MIYLSGCTAPRYERAIIDMGIGLLVQPGSYAVERVQPFPYWAADNACYPPDDDPKRKKPWDAGTWARMLGRISHLPTADQERCLFALVPDWPFSHDKTMERYDRYSDVIRAFRLPVAFAIQDGATVDTVPWNEIDVAFLAGTTEWKCGEPAYEMAVEARNRGKWVHMGRVNSDARFNGWAALIGCDSADGTFMKNGKPEDMVDRIRVWIDNETPRLTQMGAQVA